MLEVFVIAVALSMDAFAVSLGLGAKKVRRQAELAFVAALYFGLFQGLMPLLGFWGGKHVLGIVADYANWIAFFLLLAIGAKMIYESFFDNGTETQITKINQRVLFILAIATSIDAMAAGFTLNLLSFSPLLACVIIAVTTFLFSVTGVYIGAKSGTWLENKAELFGGVVLILIGVKVLMRI